jgi:hypothetical protein
LSQKDWVKAPVLAPSSALAALSELRPVEPRPVEPRPVHSQPPV